jgi:hypothetical protein
LLDEYLKHTKEERLESTGVSTKVAREKSGTV